MVGNRQRPRLKTDGCAAVQAMERAMGARTSFQSVADVKQVEGQCYSVGFEPRGPQHREHGRLRLVTWSRLALAVTVGAVQAEEDWNRMRKMSHGVDERVSDMLHRPGRPSAGHALRRLNQGRREQRRTMSRKRWMPQRQHGREER